MSPPLTLAPFAAAFVALALATACGVGLLGGVARCRPHALAKRGIGRPRSQPLPTFVRAGIVLAPLVVGALGCAALAFPDPYRLGCHCAMHGLHHPHLCLQHPGFALPLVAPAAWLLAGWLALVAPRLLRFMRAALASAHRVRALRRLPVERLDEVAVRVAECGARVAFTAGAIRPVVVVDRRLWEALSNEERRAVAYHEQGHVERGDGLSLLALRLCIALFPMPLGWRLVDAWRSAAESACDRFAASRLGDAAAVAGALVQVERIRAMDGPPSSPAQDDGNDVAMAVGAGVDLERRVRALLVRDDREPEGPLLGNDVLAAATIALGAAALTIALPGGAFHHAVETAIGLLIH